MKNLKSYKLFTESLPFDAYPGPSVISQPADWLPFLYPEDKDSMAKYGYGFSFPYNVNGPYITRWSGDGQGQLGIKGGVNGGKIGGEFDTDFRPGGEIKRDIEPNQEQPQINIPHKASPEKQRILSFLQLLNEI